MYPGFLEEATGHKSTAAIRTFTPASTAKRSPCSQPAKRTPGSQTPATSTFARSAATPRRRKKSTSAARCAIACGRSSRSSGRTLSTGPSLDNCTVTELSSRAARLATTSYGWNEPPPTRNFREAEAN
jgi:hypothetical protein